MLEWLWDKSLTVLEWPSQSPDLNPTDLSYLWKDPKMVLHRHFPSNLMEPERIFQEEWDKLPTFRCAKPLGSYPRRLKAVIAAKGASTND